jgi:hypothetical protein
VIDPSWLQFSFPTWWHYDVLRGLDYLREANFQMEDREGQPSRWNTLRALRVLDWAGAGG